MSKTIIFLGSSVTEGYASDGVSFVDMIEERYHINVIKEAVSGTTLIDRPTRGGDSYITRMKALDRGLCPDFFVCQLSTNDATRKVPLGEMKPEDLRSPEDFDVMTVAGAIEYIICYAINTWGCPVVFYTNPRYDSLEYGNMVSLLHAIAKKWKISVIDMWNDEELNRALQETPSYMADPIHPTREGYEKIFVPVISEALKIY